jgi:hypothetical protein
MEARTRLCAALLALTASLAPAHAIAQGEGRRAALPAADFEMSPEAQVAVRRIFALLPDSPDGDDRVLRLVREVARTQVVVAGARNDAAAGRRDAARTALRDHARRLRSIEGEFARSEASPAAARAVEPLRPRLVALFAALEDAAASDERGSALDRIGDLDRRLGADFEIDGAPTAPPRPTLREPRNPDLRFESAR